MCGAKVQRRQALTHTGRSVSSDCLLLVVLGVAERWAPEPLPERGLMLLMLRRCDDRTAIV